MRVNVSACVPVPSPLCVHSACESRTRTYRAAMEQLGSEVFIKSEEGAEGASTATARLGVGRLVDSTQADDRRMISLVRARPLLYARSNLPVASYHSQVKKLWREVADIMGWTVADVRRKWSHIRNSYSRHLRNELHGVRTGRGRVVSRWYLADDLEFLRAHMATDTRPCPLSLVTPTTMLYEEPSTPASVSLELTSPSPAVPAASAWYTSPQMEETQPEDDSYLQFFRGIYRDYRELSPRRQRRFRRQCLVLLHHLLDGAPPSSEMEGAVDLSSHSYCSSDSDAGAGSALPH